MAIERSCVHRGKLVALQQHAGRKFGVFACELHRLCIPGRAGELAKPLGLAACDGCSDYEQPPLGLGDACESFFASIGVTPERYASAKAAIGLDPSCKCTGRKEWLNAVGDRLGISGAADAFASWMNAT